MSSSNLSKKCICVLISNIDRLKYSIISQLKEQTDKSDIDLWLLFDEAHPYKENYSCDLSKFNVFPFTFDKIKTYSNYELLECWYGKGNIGNSIYPLLYFYNSHNDYDYYMFYEDDSLYTGDIGDLYNRIIDDRHDAYFIKEFEKINKDWTWIDERISQFKNPSIRRGDWRKLLLHMYIVNKKAISILDEALSSGKWCGHHEFLVPTILYNTKEVSLGYFHDKINKNATSWDPKFMRKYLARNGVTANSVYHPLKQFDQYDYIMFELRRLNNG